MLQEMLVSILALKFAMNKKISHFLTHFLQVYRQIGHHRFHAYSSQVRVS